jgi:GNAT superfamily N-acetyltransferase
MRHIRIQDPAALNGVRARASVPEFDVAALNRDAPDAHWVLFDDEDLIAGRFSLWWKSTPNHPGHRLGLIGHYAAGDANAGQQLLAHAGNELKARGCTLAIGPMDGSTWRQYRFVTEGNGEPRFFLEPTNPPDWPRQFAENGFNPLANYCSSVDECLDEEDEQMRRTGARMAGLGVWLRTLDTARFEEELRAIHRVATASFCGGFLYQPLAEAEFVAQYEPIRPFVRPELVTIAMHEDRPIGFIFTLPDVLQATAGRHINTAIVKTLAVLPQRRFAGLGSHLLAANRRAARGLGYRRLIHALMHESNKSRSISARYASVFRHYTLFAKQL